MRTTTAATVLGALLSALAAPTQAQGRPTSEISRLRTLNTEATRAGFGVGTRQLAAVVRRVRRMPGALSGLSAAYEKALAAPEARRPLADYLAARGGRLTALDTLLPTAALVPPTTRRGADDDGPIARFLVGGEYRSSRIRDAVVDPATGKPFARVCASSRADVLDAITAAHGAAAQTAALAPRQRAQILLRVARGLKERRAALGQLIALEAGKPLADALGEVDRAVSTFTLAAREAARLRPRLERGAGGVQLRVERVPVGVVSAIAPFNFPLNLVAHKVAPAIAAGDPIIIKPSPRTPLTALALAEIIRGTDWPRAALSVVTPRVANIAPLVKDERVRMVSFTGSENVGWKLKAQAADKRVSLELGGNAAVVVAPDADLADAVQKAVRGAFAYSGQVCIHTQRIYVHESLYGRFVEEFTRQTRQLKQGDPLLPGTQVGPLIDSKSVERARRWLAEATAGGARVLVGGQARGAFLEPTVVVGARREDKIVSEEVFAPVVTIAPYRELRGALDEVNRSRFGLQAGIFTRDAAAIETAFRTLQVGGLVVNNVPTVRLDAQPYGGVKRSGFGREGPRYALEEMTEYKTMILPPPAPTGAPTRAK